MDIFTRIAAALFMSLCLTPCKIFGQATEPRIRYIDRIANLPDYLRDFYFRYADDVEKAMRHEPSALVNPELEEYYVKGTNAATYAYTVKVFEGEVSFSCSSTDDEEIGNKAAEAVEVATAGQEDEFNSFYPYVCLALYVDFPQAFWISDTYTGFNIKPMSIRYDNETQTWKAKYRHCLCFLLKQGDYDIRREGFRTAADIEDGMKQFEASISQILAGWPNDSTQSAQLLYANNWLTTHNCYNARLSAKLSPMARSSISALKGTAGNEGPVCESYSRAMKVLCDRKGIPCVLLSGAARYSTDTPAEEHMWNYVQMENGLWYAIDVTWNDPVVAGVQEPASGNEGHQWFLLGQQSLIEEGFTFIQSHPEDPTGKFSPKGSCTWQLIPGPHLAKHSFSPESSAGQFLSKPANSYSPF